MLGGATIRVGVRKSIQAIELHEKIMDLPEGISMNRSTPASRKNSCNIKNQDSPKDAPYERHGIQDSKRHISMPGRTNEVVPWLFQYGFLYQR